MHKISRFFLIAALVAGAALPAGCLPGDDESSDAVGTISASQWQGLLTGVSFRDEATGVVSGWGGTLLRTTDGGATWVETKSGTAADLNSVAFLTDSTVVAVGSGGKMLRSTDAGATWKELESPTGETLNSVVGAGEELAIAVGWNGSVLTSDDDGATWSATIIDFPNNYVSLDYNNGASMMVSSGGFVYRTFDGDTWEPVKIPEGVTPTAVGLGGAESAMLVGEYGDMLITDNLGTDWFETTSVNTADLLCVAYLGTSSDVIAAGWDGVMLRTADRGVSWNTMTSGTTVTLRAVEALSTTKLVAVGDNGTIIISLDGGMNWFLAREDPE